MRDGVSIYIPEHAARLLARMCQNLRNDLAERTDGSMLQVSATFDSLDAIESALPDDLFE